MMRNSPFDKCRRAVDTYAIDRTHRVAGRKLQRTTAHRNALFRNMAAALIKHEQITTTVAKAKELRPYTEKLVTLAKKGGLANRRLAMARLMDDAQLAELAIALKEMLLRLKMVLTDPPYNFILHTAPPQQQRLGKPDYWSSIEYDYHWHIEIATCPERGNRVGGIWVNEKPPEVAAAATRSPAASTMTAAVPPELATAARISSTPPSTMAPLGTMLAPASAMVPCAPPSARRT